MLARRFCASTAVDNCAAVPYNNEVDDGETLSNTRAKRVAGRCEAMLRWMNLTPERPIVGGRPRYWAGVGLGQHQGQREWYRERHRLASLRSAGFYFWKDMEVRL